MSRSVLRNLRHHEKVRLGQVVAFIGLVAVLEAIGRAEWFDQLTYTPVSVMAETVIDLLLSGELTTHILSTVGMVLAAFLMATVTGLLLGGFLWRHNVLKRALDPYLIVLYAMPIFVFYPIFIVIFGLSPFPIILIAFAMSVTIIVISTANGLAKVPEVLVDVGRSLNLSRRKQFRHIIFPAAVPYIFTGLKLGFVYAFIGVIASEFILSNAGLGYQVSWYYQNFQTEQMYAVILLVIALAVIVNVTLIRIENRLYRRA